MPLLVRLSARLARIVALVASASASMFAQAPAAPKPAAPVDSFALTQPTRQSWTSDRMRFGVGDIVTILINETTAASANLTDNNNETKKTAMGLGVNMNMGATSPPTNMAVDMSFTNNGDSRKQGQASRNNNFRSTMSARVIGVSPTGMLQIRGHKLVNIDQNQQDVVVTGWVRPQDIAVGANTVMSSQIADAEINYGQKGELGKPKSGILSKILRSLWP
jgi:flagellar L-ring protein precursor FlgH